MRKLVLLSFSFFLFAFDFSCKKDYEKTYEEAYKYYSKGDVENLKKATEKFNKTFFYLFATINGQYDAYMALGLHYKDLNLYTEAIEVFEKAHQLMPKEVKPYYELGNSYMNYALVARESEKEALFKKAEENLLAGYQIKPDEIEINASLGRYYGFIQNDINKGIDHLEKVLTFEPKDYGSRLALGTLYARKKDYAKALDAYSMVKKTAPPNSSYVKDAEANMKSLRAMVSP